MRLRLEDLQIFADKGLDDMRRKETLRNMQYMRISKTNLDRDAQRSPQLSTGRLTSEKTPKIRIKDSKRRKLSQNAQASIGSLLQTQLAKTMTQYSLTSSFSKKRLSEHFVKKSHRRKLSPIRREEETPPQIHNFLTKALNIDESMPQLTSHLRDASEPAPKSMAIKKDSPVKKVVLTEARQEMRREIREFKKLKIKARQLDVQPEKPGKPTDLQLMRFAEPESMDQVVRRGKLRETRALKQTQP